MPWDSVDVWRDEDEGEEFWTRAGARETITPEIRDRIVEVKSQRAKEPRDIQARVKTSVTNQGSGGLSDRERQILVAFADGEDNQQIADRLFLSIETVKTHSKAIVKKLAARNRAHAVALAYQQGILPLPDDR